MKKLIAITLALCSAVMPIQEANAGLLFGQGGLFPAIRANREARVAARVQARSDRYNSCSTSTSYGSNGSSGYSYGSNGATGRYEVVVETTESYGSDGSTGALPVETQPVQVQYRRVLAPRLFAPRIQGNCVRDVNTGKLYCPMGATEKEICPCGENCDCENCDCNETLIGRVAPIIEEETSLAGVKAPEIKDTNVYAGL